MSSNTTIVEILHRYVLCCPGKTVIRQGKTDISFQQLENASLNLAATLIGMGAGPASPIALIMPNDAGFVASVFAAAAMGAIVVPINPELNDVELDFFIRDSGARHILTTTRLDLRISGLVSRNNGLVVIKADWTSLNVDGITTKSDKINGANCVTDFLYHYSSGSTGLPKRVVRTQENLVTEAVNLTATCGINATDRIFCSIPLFHAHGMCNAMFASIVAGATLVIMENPQPFVLNRNRALKLLEDEQITVLPGVPFQFEAMLKADKTADLSRIRLCFTAGSKLPQTVFDGFLQKFGIPIRQLYGSTETGSLCINLDEQILQTRDSVGRPIRNIRVQIWDDSGNPLPVGQEGDVAVNSPAMTRGYHQMDEMNRAVFRNGFFLPGDVGMLDADGRLTITGRKRRFIEVVGHKVDPALVEQCLIAHPSVSEAMVLGIPGNAAGSEQIKAIVVALPECTAESLIEYCRSKLASFEVPQIVEIRERIERDSVGKVQIKRLTG